MMHVQHSETTTNTVAKPQSLRRSMMEWLDSDDSHTLPQQTIQTPKWNEGENEAVILGWSVERANIDDCGDDEGEHLGNSWHHTRRTSTWIMIHSSNHVKH